MLRFGSDPTVYMFVLALPVPSVFENAEAYLVHKLLDKGLKLHEHYEFVSCMLNPKLYDEAIAYWGEVAKKEGFGFIVTDAATAILRTMKGKQTIDRQVILTRMNPEVIHAKAETILAKNRKKKAKGN